MSGPGGTPPEDWRTRYLRLHGIVHDANTGLPTYATLIDRVRGMLDARRIVGVLHLDIAKPGDVETLYGWQVLDRILSRAASRLRELVGETLPAGTVLAVNGVGGDRFVAFVPSRFDGSEVDGAFLEEIGAAARARLAAAFEGPEYAGLNPRLSFVAGHALLSENPFYRFERRVHGAVEEARRFNEARRERRERSSAEELRRIIAAAEVSTVFQPVVELATRTPIGYEALARGPKDSLFEMPLPMFAMSDRIGESAILDRLCRNSAIRSGRLVAGRGKLFVNVRPASLDDPEWRGETVGVLLEEAMLRPGDVVIELSERAIDDDPAGAASSISTLRKAGFCVSLDDVGTGYASLTTLERIRPDWVKVDASLVRDLGANLIQQEALASLVGIARRLGADVVAEGVETEAELEALSALGVRFGQGHLFARPFEPAAPGSGAGASSEIDH